jgi:hypothetical protein
VGTGLLDIPLWLMLAVIAVFVPRIVWFWRDGRLSQPVDWSPAERFSGRLAVRAFAIAALASGLTAAYVATRIPWVENFSALLGMPAVVHGRPTWPQSTASYLFAVPAALGAFASWMADPWGVEHMTFRGSREAALRVLPLIASIAAGYSMWRCISALSAAVR